jgi:hypothetical protein
MVGNGGLIMPADRTTAASIVMRVKEELYTLSREATTAELRAKEARLLGVQAAAERTDPVEKYRAIAKEHIRRYLSALEEIDWTEVRIAEHKRALHLQLTLDKIGHGTLGEQIYLAALEKLNASM